MATKTSQRKRKSAGLGDIFEINDGDLSPESENDEPEAKVLKTRNSDISESRRSIDHPNLNEQNEDKNKTNITESPENAINCATKDDRVDDLNSENINFILVEASPGKLDKTISLDDNGEVDAIKQSKTNEAGVVDLTSSPHVRVEAQEIIVLDNSSQESVFDEVDNAAQADDVVTIDDNSLNEIEKVSLKVNISNENSLEDGELNENTIDEIDSRIDATSPLISITFKDKSIADRYSEKFCKFIQSFVELTVEKLDDTTFHIFPDDNLDPNEWVVLSETICFNELKEEHLSTKEKSIKDSPKKKKKKKKHEPELFIVDINPGTPAQQHNIQTKYSAKFSIDNKKIEQEVNSGSKPGFASVCFNCAKEHSLKDCPFPKNFGRIKANRQKFQISKSKPPRYHLEEDQKYNHMHAGKLSSDLRNALGLKKNQIPSYIYQMRRLGYPPGWLEEAKIVKSELTMFDIDGNNVRNTNSKKMMGLDPAKIMEYPGFNVPLEKNYKDEYKLHRVPPFSDHFKKENMLDYFKKVAQAAEDNLETQDMELDSADILAECLPDEITESSQDKHQQDSSIDSDLNLEQSISLQELQKQKDSLLEEIRKSGETIPWEDTSQSSADDAKTEISNNSENSKEIATKETSTNKEVSQPGGISEISETAAAGATGTINTCLKYSRFGTPILKSSSPYVRLPDLDNFTKGVCPVIDFENLPNSTGKYEQMTGILQKVRTTLKSMSKSKT